MSHVISRQNRDGLVRPADVAVGPDGSVAVADWGLAEVILLGPDGVWRGAVTTSGEGPGEVQAPVAVTWVDANTLLILDVSAFRMVTLDLASRSASVTPVDPAFLSPVFAAGQVRFVALQSPGDSLAQSASRTNSD